MAGPVRYVVDANASHFFVHVFATGLAAVAAHNPKFAIRDFSGEASFVPGTLANATLEIQIKVSSLQIMDEVSKEERAAIEQVMFNEVLDARIFPEINFDSSEVAVAKGKRKFISRQGERQSEPAWPDSPPPVRCAGRRRGRHASRVRRLHRESGGIRFTDRFHRGGRAEDQR
jgi:hypothetical protein